MFKKMHKLFLGGGVRVFPENEAAANFMFYDFRLRLA
jgi:hypothetical protein